jgi:hypothetical protein
MQIDPPSEEEIAHVIEVLVENPTGNLVEDLYAAGREVMRRRKQNTIDGGIVIAALRARGLSWSVIERHTYISTRSARRWAESPPEPFQT